MNSWQKVKNGQPHLQMQVKSDQKVENVKKNLRISGEKIMRTEHNTKSKRRSLIKVFNYKAIIKHFNLVLFSFFISFMALSVANAIPISGKVFLDYDGNSNNVNFPLKNLPVELKDYTGAKIASVNTDEDGAYEFDVSSLGSYNVEVKTTNNESVSKSVSVSGMTGELGQNLFLKGNGGTVHLKVKDYNNQGINDLPVKLLNTSTKNVIVLDTNSNGEVEIKNTLLNDEYTVYFDAEVDIFLKRLKYKLWDVTLPNGNNTYDDKIKFAMKGAEQSGSFNLKKRNPNKLDGIIAFDMDNDGLYTVGTDPGLEGIRVDIYYENTTIPVMGTSPVTTGDDGFYGFSDLAVATYDIVVSNVPAPPFKYLPSDLRKKAKIPDEIGNPTGPDFLFQIDPNDTTLSSISGNVFVIGPQQYLSSGPDSGKSDNNIYDTSVGSRGMSTKVALYQHTGSEWKKISTTKTNGTTGFYQFIGLTKGKDYKVSLTEFGIDQTKFYFINDTDGKSTSTSPNSRSSHKGKVTLSNNTKDNIAGKEIIIPNLNNKKGYQNFWYSPVQEALGNLMVVNYLETAGGHWSWSTTYNGLEANSASTYTKIVFYEEDGVTQATDSKNNKLEVTYKRPGYYGLRDLQNYYIDRCGLFNYKVEGYDTNLLEKPTSLQNFTVMLTPGRVWDDRLIFVPKQKNTISGYVYLNNSHPGVLGSYVPNNDTAIKYNRVVLDRKVDGEWVEFTNFSTDENGKYEFTNLPNGDYRITAKQTYGLASNIKDGDLVFENNDQNKGFSIDPGNNKKTISQIELSVNGGRVFNTNTNFWYKLRVDDYVIRGTVYLDTWLADSKIQTGQLYNSNDLPLKYATVLLCRDGNESDCTENGINFLDKQITDGKGDYTFNGQLNNVTPNTDYMIKVKYDGIKTVTNASENLYPFYRVKFTTLDAPITKNFLMQGKGTISGAPINDINGDTQYAGEQTIEVGKGNFALYYWDTDHYEYWADIGDYYHAFDLKSLPKGKYKIVHKTSTDDYIDIADQDPATEPGTLQFEVQADGSLANGMQADKQWFMQANTAPEALTEAVSGNIYLDVTGSNVKNDQSILLTKEELERYNPSKITVEGVFTPRLYKNHYSGSFESLFNTPDFIDKGVKDNARFVYNKTNARLINKLYISNMMLKLKGLDNAFEIVGNSGQTKGSYLPNKVQNGLEYMQVELLQNGTPDQYWLLRLRETTEIGGKLYYDYDNNGIFEPNNGDVPMTGVRVELYRNGSNNVYSYTMTDGNGNYKFTNLLYDDYKVKVTAEGLDTSRYELKSLSDTISNIKITQSNPTVPNGALDFLYKKEGDSSIYGYVLIDINNNGEADINFDKTGDVPVQNVTINLYKGPTATGSPFKTIKTNQIGVYSFDLDKNQLNDTYVVQIVPPSGYGVISNADKNTNTVLSPISFSSGRQNQQSKYFLLAGGTNPNPSAGITSPTAINSGISGKTLIDDPDPTNYKPLKNVLLSLIDENGKEMARQNSDENGEYHFYNLPSGNYKVNVKHPPAYYVVVRNSVSTTQPIDTISGIAITNSGVTDKTFFYSKASHDGIQGDIYVDFNDTNTDTSRLNEYAHLINSSNQVTVKLYDGLNGTGQLLMTQLTTNGHYHFADLLYGNDVDYSVKIEMNTLPGYDFKFSKAGNRAQDIVIPVKALKEEGSLDNHYVVLGKLQLGGDVWIDNNSDKIKTDQKLTNDVEVELSYQEPNTDTFKTLNKTKTANIALNGNASKNGQYLFDKLPKDYNYQIKVSTPNSTVLVPATDIPNNTNTFNFEPLTDNDFNSSTAFKYTGRVSGQVVIDVDDSKDRTGVDTSFAGVKLVLTKVSSSNFSGGQTPFEATTDPNGNFVFDNIPVGTWAISTASSQTITDWNSYVLNYTTIGNNVVPIQQSNNLSLEVEVTADQNVVDNIDIGYRGNSKITGYVVIDRDSDGVYSSNDISFGQLATPITPKITLTSATNKAGFKTKEFTVDASTGLFEITGLSAYNYEISSNVSDSNYKLVFSPGNPSPVSETATFNVNGPNDTSFEANPNTRVFGYQFDRKLSGNVYLDIGGNESEKTFNPKLDGAVVKVEGELSNNKHVTHTKTVGSNGEFTFNNITEGKWTVSVSHPTRTDLTYSYFVEKVVTPTAVNNNSITYEVDSNTGNEIKLDLGMKGQAKITGKVVFDNDADEQLSSFDTGVDGLTIKLIDPNSDTVIYKEAVSNSDGEFTFDNLANGSYRIRVTDPSNKLNGYVISFSPSGQASANTASDIATISISGDAAQSDRNDFGYKSNLGISGHIYQDIMGNGQHNTNYPPLAGVGITAVNQSNNLTINAVSLADGSYSLNNLIAGTWIIKISNSPSGWNYSYFDAAVGNATISEVNPGELKIIIASNDTVGKNINFGLKGSAKISGKVVVDVDVNDNVGLNYHAASIDRPLSGVEVTLKANGLNGTTAISTTTGSDGSYKFENLTAYNDYELTVNDSNLTGAGYQISFSPAMINGGSAINHDTLALTSATQDLAQIDYGYKSQKTLKGTIYKDVSGKGVHQTYDTTLAGVTVEARDVNDHNIVLTAISDPNGQYEINNIAEGQWDVTVNATAVAGYSYSYVIQPQGSNSTSITNGTRIKIEATSSNLVTNVDFGLKGQASISGQVVIDVDTQDGNAISSRDIGIDSLIPNYQVELFVDDNLIDKKAATTTGTNIDELGKYQFDNLASGISYKVKVSMGSNSYISSFMLTDSNIAATINKTDNLMEETYQFASATDQAKNVTFAWSGISGIKGKVFLDNNDDGEYNPSIDTAINAPITITFKNVNNPSINFTRNLAAGDIDYDVANLIPGKWSIEIAGVPSTLKASFDPDDAHHNANGELKLPQTANIAVINITGKLSDQNFGYINGGIIEGKVLDDNQGAGLTGVSGYKGLSGVKVYLLDGNKNHIMDRNGRPIVSTSNDNGKFNFRNLISDTTRSTSARYFIRVLYGDYNDGTVSVGRGNPLYDLIPSFDKYRDASGNLVEHDLINLSNPPATINFNGVGGEHTVPVMVNDGTSNLAYGILLGYRSSDADITIAKIALKDKVTVGDIVPYSIKITNNSSRVSTIKIKDVLPAGFKFVKGSTRLNGKKVEDPTGGRTVNSQLIQLKPKGELTFTYMLVVGAGVTQGEYTNTAVAVNSINGKVVSNTSQATVTVTADPLFDDALIFGKVYVDKNGNGVQDEGEEGLGGVKLVTVRGEIITTDASGRYHIVGVSGGRWERGANFVLKLDTRSLPKGYEVIGRNPKVVRVSPGLPSKVDFTVSEEKSQ